MIYVYTYNIIYTLRQDLPGVDTRRCTPHGKLQPCLRAPLGAFGWSSPDEGGHRPAQVPHTRKKDPRKELGKYP